MVTKTIAWGDGTLDKITVTYSGTSGSVPMIISSNENASLNQRTKSINLNDHNDVTLAIVVVTQKPRSRAYSTAYKTDYK